MQNHYDSILYHHKFVFLVSKHTHPFDMHCLNQRSFDIKQLPTVSIKKLRQYLL